MELIHIPLNENKIRLNNSFDKPLTINQYYICNKNYFNLNANSKLILLIKKINEIIQDHLDGKDINLENIKLYHRIRNFLILRFKEDDKDFDDDFDDDESFIDDFEGEGFDDEESFDDNFNNLNEGGKFKKIKGGDYNIDKTKYLQYLDNIKTFNEYAYLQNDIITNKDTVFIDSISGINENDYKSFYINAIIDQNINLLKNKIDIQKINNSIFNVNITEFINTNFSVHCSINQLVQSHGLEIFDGQLENERYKYSRYINNNNWDNSPIIFLYDINKYKKYTTNLFNRDIILIGDAPIFDSDKNMYIIFSREIFNESMKDFINDDTKKILNSIFKIDIDNKTVNETSIFKLIQEGLYKYNIHYNDNIINIYYINNVELIKDTKFNVIPQRYYIPFIINDITPYYLYECEKKYDEPIDYNKLINDIIEDENIIFVDKDNHLTSINWEEPINKFFITYLQISKVNRIFGGQTKYFIDNNNNVIHQINNETPENIFNVNGDHTILDLYMKNAICIHMAQYFKYTYCKTIKSKLEEILYSNLNNLKIYFENIKYYNNIKISDLYNKDTHIKNYMKYYCSLLFINCILYIYYNIKYNDKFLDDINEPSEINTIYESFTSILENVIKDSEFNKYINYIMTLFGYNLEDYTININNITYNKNIVLQDIILKPIIPESLKGGYNKSLKCHYNKLYSKYYK